MFRWRAGRTKWTWKGRRVDHGWVPIPSIGNDRPIEDSTNVVYFGGPLQSRVLEALRII